MGGGGGGGGGGRGGEGGVAYAPYTGKASLVYTRGEGKRSPIIDGPEIARIQRLFRMILGVAEGRLSLLSRMKAFKQSVLRESNY